MNTTTNDMATACLLAGSINENETLKAIGVTATVDENPKGIEVRVALHRQRIGQVRFYDGCWQTELRSTGAGRPASGRAPLPDENTEAALIGATHEMVRLVTVELTKVAQTLQQIGLLWPALVKKSATDDVAPEPTDIVTLVAAAG
jgi:hypothetical protein